MQRITTNQLHVTTFLLLLQFGLNLDEYLEKLAASRFCKIGFGDDNIQREDMGKNFFCLKKSN